MVLHRGHIKPGLLTKATGSLPVCAVDCDSVSGHTTGISGGGVGVGNFFLFKGIPICSLSFRGGKLEHLKQQLERREWSSRASPEKP